MDNDNDEEQPEQSSLKQIQDDLDIANNNWKRALADFENYKRRKEGESRELVEFAREVTVAKLLPTIDSLEQALKHLPQYTPTTPSRQGGAPLLKEGGEASAFAEASADRPQLSQDNGGASPPAKGEYPAERGEGVGANDFEKKYQNWQKGVNGIVIQLDKVLGELGVKKIESLGKKFDPNFHEAVREVESDKDDGIVVEEFQTGFELNGKVIRPSQVAISKRQK